jgi:hypothetical protein
VESFSLARWKYCEQQVLLVVNIGSDLAHQADACGSWPKLIRPPVRRGAAG